ncbi:MAG: ABC transporter ATP-binding protein [Myxococcales bacterium]|nr:ABC transporter ATP-binding protein [Myxococcales bacterium]MBK7196812.1 ABC transporter ATP-binding protein [Myxococcales bacterium]MBP6844835.1 ABC transporter ATP-binding protein [Kofleriaceae bacterium]
MKGSPVLVKLTSLSKTYRAAEVETAALADVNLDIAEGEFVAIMGPSGCGKSTLLNILGMLDTPSAGAYRFRDQDISRWREAKLADLRKRNLGFVFQSFNLIDELTVEGNVELALLYQGISAAERKGRVAEALDRMKIAHRAKHFPAALSGGQQQRVAVARAVVGKPALILADEPTGNLDSHHGDEVMKLLRELNAAGTTIVMVTHSSAHAEYARRTINLFDGRVLTEQLRAAS